MLVFGNQMLKAGKKPAKKMRESPNKNPLSIIWVLILLLVEVFGS